MADIFISYARSTEAQAERIANALRALGYDVWRDNQIPAHRSFAEVIEERLGDAKAVLVIWSSEAVKSEWVQSEADAARLARKLVQTTIDDAKLPMPFDRIQCANLKGWTGDLDAPGWKTVVSSIAELTGRSGLDTAARGAGTVPARVAGVPRGRLLLAIGGLVIALVVAAGAAVFKWATPFAPPPAATVQLTGFKAVGGDVPADLPTKIFLDVRDAFGEDNIVTIRDHGADFVLRGDVRRVEDRFRYSVQLQDIRDGTLVWSSSREWPVTSPRRSREAAVSTTQAVRCGLRGAGEYPRRLPHRTLGLFLQFCDHNGPQEQSLALTRRIVAETPDFARGWSGLALWALYVASDSSGPGEKQALRTEAERAVAQALRLDPSNGQAYEAKALMQPANARIEAERLLRRAVASHLTDCGCELLSYAAFLQETGRLQAANQVIHHAFELQPLGWDTNVRLAVSYDAIGQPALAEQVYAKAAQIYGDNVPFRLFYARHAGLAGRWKESVQWVSANSQPPDRPYLLAVVSALQSGDPARIAAARPGMEQVARSSHGRPDLIQLLLAVGSKDEAFSEVEAKLKEELRLGFFLFTPRFVALRHDPRYARMMETTGLMSYWRATKSKPDLCAAPDAPTFCQGL